MPPGGRKRNPNQWVWPKSSPGLQGAISGESELAVIDEVEAVAVGTDGSFSQSSWLYLPTHTQPLLHTAIANHFKGKIGHITSQINSFSGPPDLLFTYSESADKIPISTNVSNSSAFWNFAYIPPLLPAPSRAFSCILSFTPPANSDTSWVLACLWSLEVHLLREGIPMTLYTTRSWALSTVAAVSFL